MSDHATPTSEVKDGHDSHGEHHGSFYEHVKPYLIVGVLLFVFTAITVGLSYIDFDHMLGRYMDHANIKIGLAVATFKVCLVGAWFMHLKQEKATIWRPLIFTIIFCGALFVLVVAHYKEPIPRTTHTLHHLELPAKGATNHH